MTDSAPLTEEELRGPIGPGYSPEGPERMRRTALHLYAENARLREAHEAHTSDGWCPICDPDMAAREALEREEA